MSKVQESSYEPASVSVLELICQAGEPFPKMYSNCVFQIQHRAGGLLSQCHGLSLQYCPLNKKAHGKKREKKRTPHTTRNPTARNSLGSHCNSGIGTTTGSFVSNSGKQFELCLSKPQQSRPHYRLHAQAVSSRSGIWE